MSFLRSARGAAAVAWVASFAHLLVLFNRAVEFSFGTVLVAATGLLASLPAIWAASAVIIAPGDVDAALATLLGRDDDASAKRSRSRSRSRASDDPPHSSDEAPSAADAIEIRRGGGGGSDAPPRPSPARPRSPARAAERAAPAAPNLRAPSDLDASLASSRGDGSHHTSVSRHASGVSRDASDASDASGWQDALASVRGMAQALCDANTSAAFVALNADLTVSLSRLMIKTLKLLDPTGEAGAGDAGEDARVCQLDDPHAVVRDTCAVAEPLFSDRTPLVLRNELEPGELAFVPRDTFQCCLYALVYRAGTRILRGRCVMTARAEDPEGGLSNANNAASPPVYARGEQQKGRPGPPAHRLLVVSVAYETAQSTAPGAHSASPLGATELKFWRRRLLRVGGSLAFEAEDVDVATRRERIVLSVPAAGSDTFFKDVFIDPDPAARAEKNAEGDPTSVLERAVARSSAGGSGGARSSPAGSERASPAGGFDDGGERDDGGDRDRDGDRDRRPTEAVEASAAAEARAAVPPPPGAAAVVPPGAAVAPPGSGAGLPPRFQPPPSSSGGGPSSGLLSSSGLLVPGAPPPANHFPFDASSASSAAPSHPLDAAQLAALEATARRELRVARGAGYPRDGNFSGRDSAFSSFQDSLFETTEPLHFRILYVEDERVQAYFFVKKCRRVFGPRCEVVHETDGVAALERLERGEQFAVVVSDIFMSGMDGVSFFRALFSTTLNSGRLKDPNAPAAYSSGGGFFPRRRSPRTSAGATGEVDKNDGAEDSSDADLRMNLILTGAEISPDFRDDRELADDLESLAETHGVLTYNKISGVDVVADVIAPHVAYVEQKLALRRAAEMWRASRAGEGDADAAAFGGGTANVSLPGRSMDGAGGTGGTKAAAAAAEEEEDDEYRALRASVMEKLETFASGASGAASARRGGGGAGAPGGASLGIQPGRGETVPGHVRDQGAVRLADGRHRRGRDDDPGRMREARSV